VCSKTYKKRLLHLESETRKNGKTREKGEKKSERVSERERAEGNIRQGVAPLIVREHNHKAGNVHTTHTHIHTAIAAAAAAVKLE
jgi:hypothetical protein